MTFIKVHKYENKEQALQAIQVINDALGIPKNYEAVTRTYAQPIEKDDFWYFHADKVTEKYIGEGVEIEIKQDFEI